MNFWNRELVIKKKKISVKDLLLSIPTYYKEHFEVDLNNFNYEKDYLFTFYPKQVFKIKDKIKISGISKNKLIIIWHSAKLYKLIRLNITHNSPMCFLGKINETFSSFYPKITKFNEEILVEYEYKTNKIIRNILQELIREIENKNIKENLNKIHFPNNISEAKEALSNLAIIEIAVFAEKIASCFLKKKTNAEKFSTKN